jgi:hypothetical protein
MSIELHVFMQDSRVPSRDAWQEAIVESGFPTVLDPSLNLRQDTGFRPTTYKEQSTGYEFYLGPSAGILSNYKHLKSQVGNRDICATFCWGGDLMECAAALSSAAALTKLTDGIYFYPDDDVIYTAADVVEATRRDLSSI